VGGQRWGGEWKKGRTPVGATYSAYDILMVCEVRLALLTAVYLVAAQVCIVGQTHREVLCLHYLFAPCNTVSSTQILWALLSFHSFRLYLFGLQGCYRSSSIRPGTSLCYWRRLVRSDLICSSLIDIEESLRCGRSRLLDSWQGQVLVLEGVPRC
jgi:hypothetical protein